MICLFVSFEVKSESDDLTGKKLLCEQKRKSNGYIFFYTGYEFEDSSRVKIYQLSLVEKQKPFIRNFPGKYNTSLENISIEQNILEYPLINLSINRLTLNIKDYRMEHKCKVIDEDLNTLLNLKFFDRKKEYDLEVKEIKRKQKI